MPVYSDDPITIDEQVIPAVSLDRWWLPEFRITAAHPAVDVKLHATMRKYGIDSSGTPRLADAITGRLQLRNLFAIATVDQAAGALIEQVTAKIVQVAKATTAYREAYNAATLPEGIVEGTPEAEATRQAAGNAAADAVWPYFITLASLITLDGEVK